MRMASTAVKAQPLNDRLSKRNFERLSAFIYRYSGIKMPATKHTMLEGRLRRRLRATNILTFDAYCDYVFDHGGLETELVHLVDAVTTNKTDFFREPKHFDYMRDVALPALVKQGVGSIRAWSSACSTGAEPYTMAMVLDTFFETRRDGSYSILATDLSTDVLEKARLGIYPTELIEPVPDDMRHKYILTAANASRRDVRVTPYLRSKIGFGRMNLMDARYNVGAPMHIIFCRNVLIYFDKETQSGVLQRLCDCLVPGGYLFIGHSETIAGLDLPVRTVANTVFQRV
ncbi:protein-glutamate O-methyltransferase CheR [Mesorhizobium sp. CAU 1741]|uniref:CheR family methyltransferase n=1 Tax=Mesorhizobium sp. CAU 1741 TaxID=3140366 RepID=UPI00325BDC5E